MLGSRILPHTIRLFFLFHMSNDGFDVGRRAQLNKGGARVIPCTYSVLQCCTCTSMHMGLQPPLQQLQLLTEKAQAGPDDLHSLSLHCLPKRQSSAPETLLPEASTWPSLNSKTDCSYQSDPSARVQMAISPGSISQPETVDALSSSAFIMLRRCASLIMPKSACACSIPFSGERRRI